MFLLLVIFVLLYLLLKIPNTKKSIFWNNQPVIRNIEDFNYKGFLFDKLPDIEIGLSKKYEFSLDTNNISEWISSNFSKYYEFSKNHLLEEKNNKISNIILKYNKKIVGFIHVRYMNWLFDLKEYKIGFVDYLCIEPNFRNNNLASIMISKMIEETKLKSDCKGFIFKIDNKPLNFPYWLKSNYYVKFLKKKENGIKKENTIFYEKFNNLVKRTFKIFPKIEKDDFENHYNKGIYKCFNSENLICLGREGIMDGMRILDIDIIVGEMGEWEEIEKRLSEEYNILSVVRMGKIDDEFLKEWQIGNEVYYYFYNFSYPRMDIKKVWINFS